MFGDKHGYTIYLWFDSLCMIIALRVEYETFIQLNRVRGLLANDTYTKVAVPLSLLELNFSLNKNFDIYHYDIWSFHYLL